MKKISIDHLKAGMKFDAPVYIDNKNILVPPGIPIKEKDIERLRKWEIKNVLTNGNPLIKEEVHKENNEIFKMQPLEKKCLEVYNSIVLRLTKIFDDIKNKKIPDHKKIDKIVNDIYTNVKKHKNKMIQLILHAEKDIDDVTINSVNNTIISIIIGVKLKTFGHRVIVLATAAIVHDVGMLRISEKIYNKKENLSEQELNVIHTHPIHSYRIISKELKYPEEIAQIALCHQERWDGKGYPKHIKGENIPLFARIVAVADSYVAMVNKRPYRDEMIGYNAIKSIISDNFKKFDPNIVKAFLKGMGIYPIGSIVLLNNSTIGRVIEIHDDAPLRPKIEIIINELGIKMEKSVIIDLLKNSNYFIVKAVDPKLINM